MRTSTLISGIAAALLATGAAAKTKADFTVDKAAPLSTEGRAVLDAEAGPVAFGEVLIQDVPTEADPRRDPKPVVLVSNRGDAVAHFTLTVTLEDDQGNVLAKGVRSAKVDEDTSNEIFAVSLSGNLKPGDWQKVKVVHLVVRLSTKV
jgi:hypothetical protein